MKPSIEALALIAVSARPRDFLPRELFIVYCLLFIVCCRNPGNAIHLVLQVLCRQEAAAVGFFLLSFFLFLRGRVEWCSRRVPGGLNMCRLFEHFSEMKEHV